MTKRIKIALAGNPNCGKTTLFNMLTGANQFVGNWPGVTVEKKEGFLKSNKNIIITDLPGIYSLSSQTPDEMVARNFLTLEKPDVILNIVDGTSLERNLYLTTQLLELDIPVVIAVNMTDILRKNGDILNCDLLSEKLNAPVCEISALKGTGIKKLIKIATSSPKSTPLKLFDNAIKDSTKARYDYIEQVIKACYRTGAKNKYAFTHKLDKLVINRYAAFPIFLTVMFMICYISVYLVGTHTSKWTDNLLFNEGIIILNKQIPSASACILNFMERFNSPLWLKGLVTDGILGGVGTVISFIPQMIVLFLMLSFLESCGYMSRIAFILDRLFKAFGLSGKTFIPLMVGTGCSVPGILATRTLENDRDRKITIITTSFIPCSAKLPVIAFISASLFKNAWWVAPSAYFMGIAAVALSGIILKKFKYISDDLSPVITELPLYRLPSFKNLIITVWGRISSFIKRAGTVILSASVLIWLAAHTGIIDGKLTLDNNMNLNSGFLGIAGQYICIIFKPLGFNSPEAAIATLMGLVAKEEIVAVLNILKFSNMSQQAGFSFMAFNLLCAPCIGAISAMRNELNSIKWTAFAIFYQCIFAYAASLCIYQLGMAFSGNINLSGFIAAIIIIALFLQLILKKSYSVFTIKSVNIPSAHTYKSQNCTINCLNCKKCKKCNENY